MTTYATDNQDSTEPRTRRALAECMSVLPTGVEGVDEMLGEQVSPETHIGNTGL